MPFFSILVHGTFRGSGNSCTNVHSSLSALRRAPSTQISLARGSCIMTIARPIAILSACDGMAAAQAAHSTFHSQESWPSASGKIRQQPMPRSAWRSSLGLDRILPLIEIFDRIGRFCPSFLQQRLAFSVPNACAASARESRSFSLACLSPHKPLIPLQFQSHLRSPCREMGKGFIQSVRQTGIPGETYRYDESVSAFIFQELWLAGSTGLLFIFLAS